MKETTLIVRVIWGIVHKLLKHSLHLFMFAYLTAWMVFTTDGADAPELLALFGVWEAMAFTNRLSYYHTEKMGCHSVELQTAAIFRRKMGVALSA